jgi:hypothetical protein
MNTGTVRNKAVFLVLHNDIMFWHLSRGKITKIKNLPMLFKAGA